MKLTDVRAFLFPYCTHLEAEVEYLKGQLAQKQRRIDEMQDAINKAALKPATVRLQPAPPHAVPPKGWDAYRVSKRGETNDGIAEITEASGEEESQKHASSTTKAG